MRREFYLPHFPRTPHIPWNPNKNKDDIVAADSESAVVFNSNVFIQEKIDGASVGFAVVDDHPVIRNREHFLSKGFIGRTPAKKQFSSIYNYYYSNSKQFKILTRIGPYSVYGEWMKMQHGIFYDQLPDWFIAYDIWNWQSGCWLPPLESIKILQDCGFNVPARIHTGLIQEYQQLESFLQTKSQWSDSKIEGIYIRVGDDHRFKMVRSDFVAGALWDSEVIENRVIN